MHYEKQEEGFSISLDVDFDLYPACTAFFIQQSSRTVSPLVDWTVSRSTFFNCANYTNGQNNPLGKIVVANFNNQNGLKIGNATYTETAVSGTPQVAKRPEGFGNIPSGSLERSNVDITEELKPDYRTAELPGIGKSD